jgi:hypothetical protein
MPTRHESRAPERQQVPLRCADRNDKRESFAGRASFPGKPVFGKARFVPLFCRPVQNNGHNGLEINAGAEEGTRTPTPLRVHGPEPCASANSATSAFEMRRPVLRQRSDRDYFYILTGIAGLSNPTALYLRGAVAGMGAVIAETGAPALLSGIPTLSWLWSGPRPSLMMARESGVTFDCHPWSL